MARVEGVENVSERDDELTLQSLREGERIPLRYVQEVAGAFNALLFPSAKAG